MHQFSVVSVYVSYFLIVVVCCCSVSFLLSTDVKEVEKDDDERGYRKDEDTVQAVQRILCTHTHTHMHIPHAHVKLLN